MNNNLRSSKSIVNSQLFNVMRRGAMTLPVIIIIAGIIMEVAIAGVVISTSFTTGIFGARLSAIALSAARSGADDAVMRILRNKNCPDTECPASYSINVGGATADVTITYTDIGGGLRQYTVNSTGKISGRNKKMQAVLITDDVSGESRETYFKEISL